MGTLPTVINQFSSLLSKQDCFIIYMFWKLLTETGLAGGLAYTDNLLPAAPMGLLGLLLLFQVQITRNRWCQWKQSKLPPSEELCSLY